MREEYLSNVNEYDGKLEPLMKSLCDTQHWRHVDRQQLESYYFEKLGVTFIKQVLCQGYPELG